MKFLNRFKINQAINLLKKNEIIILPTDTIYGLSSIVNADNAQKINELKQSDLTKPLIILVSNLKQASKLIEMNDDVENYLMSDYPTTVIAKSLKNKQSTIAIRVVKRKDIKTIIDNVGPIYSTSVNVSGQNPLSEKSELFTFLGKNKCFFIGNLNNPPSRLVNIITNEKKRWNI
ncbi:L-threonylcarbamoyladenylate synthase [Spiroplasma apis]|uniref:L-threonylcarbamoyladenylate synthase n=1 Tax=Spiroplasma apis B31 TaxID=1276258 RepID=V5RJC0_SPIAP|nr:Sua5/YciO/YrdC/YwlC family protein [Spiroplasma apis]AHB36802.1 tRNA threonylcarbamoyladenosine biosynthesis protein [Spiroplasma apis B31]